MFISEQVYKHNLFKENKAANSRELINSQLLITIDWLLAKDLVVCLHSWEQGRGGGVFLLSSFQTSSHRCNHFLHEDLERSVDGGDVGMCHVFESDPNEDMKASSLERSQAHTTRLNYQ